MLKLTRFCCCKTRDESLSQHLIKNIQLLLPQTQLNVPMFLFFFSLSSSVFCRSTTTEPPLSHTAIEHLASSPAFNSMIL